MFSGFVVSLIVWVYFIEPVWNIDMPLIDNIKISMVFTATAIVRGYFWRRYFNIRLFRKNNIITK